MLPRDTAISCHSALYNGNYYYSYVEIFDQQSHGETHLNIRHAGPPHCSIELDFCGLRGERGEGEAYYLMSPGQEFHGCQELSDVRMSVGY